MLREAVVCDLTCSTGYQESPGPCLKLTHRAWVRMLWEGLSRAGLVVGWAWVCGEKLGVPWGHQSLSASCHIMLLFHRVYLCLRAVF